MGNKIITEIVESKDHPLEEFFDIEPNSTEVVKVQQTTELVKSADYDAKDEEIEQDFQEIIDHAMTGFNSIQENMDDIEPKYVSRAYEVSNQLLGTALAAAKEKAGLKAHKDKLGLAKAKVSSGSTTNNLIVTDTNSLIQQLKNGGIMTTAKTIEVTPEPTPAETEEDDDTDSEGKS